MKTRKLVGRLAVAVVLVGMLVLLTASPAFPAQPEGATLGLVVPAMWAGHPQCKANVDVTLAGVSNVGGYETKLSFSTTTYSYVTNNINLRDYLAVNGRLSSGDCDPGNPGVCTPLLESIGTGNVKWGDYSWGSGAGAGVGTISSVGLGVVACGNSTMSLSGTETQVVDTQGAPFGIDAQATNIPAVVHLNTDINGSGAVTAIDVNLTRNALNAATTPQCADNTYRFDVNNSGAVTALDVNMVRNALNASATCPNP